MEGIIKFLLTYTRPLYKGPLYAQMAMNEEMDHILLVHPVTCLLASYCVPGLMLKAG